MAFWQFSVFNMSLHVLNIRLEKDTASLLRSGAFLRRCDQNVLLEEAVREFIEQRTAMLSLSPVPVPMKDSRDGLLFSKMRRVRRRFYKDQPVRFSTTISPETKKLLATLTAKFTRSDLVDRAIRFHLWGENRRDFQDFLYPKINDENWREVLDL